MTTTDRAVRVLHESLDRIWGYDAPDWADDIAADLHDAGLIAPEPRIIRTRDELAALDPDTVLGVWHPDLDMGCILMPAREWADNPSVTPLAVIATGDHVRAARQALKEATE